MRTFIVNLKDNVARREAIQRQLTKTTLNYSFIEAVYGAALPDEKLYDIVFDYPNCKLTKGEIGCALSHLKIYKMMIDENIDHALVLEDDAIILGDIEPALTTIINNDNINKPNIYLLSKPELYLANQTKIKNIHKVYDASGTHGYVINRTAAKKLLKEQYPIKYEADMWSIFRFKRFINLFCFIPYMIGTLDETKSDSSLEKNRYYLKKERELYRDKLKKKDRFYQYYRITNLIYKKIHKMIKLY